MITLVLLVCWLGSVLSSCSIMGTTGGNALMVSSYFAEDSDIYAAEDYYISLERNLQSKVDNIESTYAGYDEYNYNIAGIGHNPYELISYLTAVYQDFTFNDIKGELDTLFNQQYHLQISERTETRTDEDGNEYTYKILNATLTNSGFTSSMNAEQQEEFRRQAMIPDGVPLGFEHFDEFYSKRKVISRAETSLRSCYIFSSDSVWSCLPQVCCILSDQGISSSMNPGSLL